MGVFKHLILAIILALGLTACAFTDRLLGGSSVIEAAEPAERLPLRVIAASLTVKGAYEAVEQHLDDGLTSPEDAAIAKSLIDEAARAVEIAAAAVELGGGASEVAMAEAAVRAFLQSKCIEENLQ